MTWQIEDTAQRVRVLIAVSKLGHCLQDLLYHWRSGVMPVDIVGVVSNHTDLRGLVEWHQIPFFHLPVTDETRNEQEAAILELMSRYRVDLLVLARYMQILSNEMCRAISGRCINIHHSFLPSFKGARPYHQAYERGVKIIGATAHYVTPDLDEGPIIEQAVERVGHEHTPERFQEIGRDLEAIVLARAVRWHAERRILLDGQRSVILS
jgi:formyltetrahydrofolate deformylase